MLRAAGRGVKPALSPGGCAIPIPSLGMAAAIPGILRAGKTGIKILDSILNRVFKGSAEVLTAWGTASHVERAPKPAGLVPVPAPVA